MRFLLQTNWFLKLFNLQSHSFATISGRDIFAVFTDFSFDLLVDNLYIALTSKQKFFSVKNNILINQKQPPEVVL